MYLKTTRQKQERGQGLLVTVMTMTILATSVAMYALERSRVSQRDSVDFKRASDTISTLNATARYLQNIYYNEANCDPYVFNLRVNAMTNRAYQSPFRQQHLVDSGAGTTSYSISLGEMDPPPPATQDLDYPVGAGAGTSPPKSPYVDGSGNPLPGYGPQDLTVTYWVVPYGTTGSEQGRVRYKQTITLLNTCSPITDTSLGIPVMGAINDAATFSTAVQDVASGAFAARGHCGTTPRGSIDGGVAGVGGSATALDSNDSLVLQNYVRSGVTTGINVTTCLDTNNDNLYNEIDLNVIDKTLKGYLYFTSPSNE